MSPHVRHMEDLERPDTTPMPLGLFRQEDVKAPTRFAFTVFCIDVHGLVYQVRVCPDEQLGMPTSCVQLAQHSLDVEKPWLLTHGTKNVRVAHIADAALRGTQRGIAAYYKQHATPRGLGQVLPSIPVPWGDLTNAKDFP
eukprot:6329614-Amphidinium_carterae.1